MKKGKDPMSDSKASTEENPLIANRHNCGRQGEGWVGVEGSRQSPNRNAHYTGI
jgi:hypothetical protein